MDNLPSDDEFDEVSLPGVGDNEQPTILEVLNRGIINTEDGTGTLTEPTKEEPISGDTVNTIKITSTLEEEPKTPKSDQESDNLVSSSSSSTAQVEWNEPQRSQLVEDDENVYDFESHLIETLNNYSVSEDSESWGVDIKELPPAEGESLHRTSKIETDPLVGTVFEVEPATPKVLKPIETSVPELLRQSGLAQEAQIKDTSPGPEVKDSNVNKPRATEQSNGDANKVETTGLDQSGLAQEPDEASSPEEEAKPIWTIVKELQSEFGEDDIRKTDTKAQVEPDQGVDRVDCVDCVEPKLDCLSSESKESKANSNKTQIDQATPDRRVDLVQSVDRVDLDTPALGEVIHDSREQTYPLKAQIDLGASGRRDQEECTDRGVEPKIEAVRVIAQLTEPTKPVQERVVEPESEPSPVSINENKAKTDDNAQSIDATKTQIEPTAPDPAKTEKLTTGATIETSNEDTKTDLLSKEFKHTTDEVEETASLTQEIDQKLSELATHLTNSSVNGNLSNLELTTDDLPLDVNGLPLPKTALEEEQRQQFLDSLPQLSLETDSNKVAALAKREYYQSLRQYLITHSSKPPVPPETYRWEDLKRAKQRGGYPWTHLYKRPLGPDEEPEIVLLLRKSQELRFSSESPKSFKKVRIDDQVSIKETERYIQELSDTEDNPPTEDEEEEQEDERSECISCVSDSVLTVEKRASKLGKIRGILKKRSPKKEVDSRSLPDTSTAPSTSLTSNHKSEEDIRERQSRPIKDPHNKAKCFPIMKKLRSMADRQKKNFRNIKKISLKKDEKISLEEEQKIIKLKTSPKAERSEIPHFIEKQDSDDVLEIVELDESPSRKRKDHLEHEEQAAAAAAAAESTVLVPDEIIEIPTTIKDESLIRQPTPEPTVLEEVQLNQTLEAPPKKTARLRREHVYEDIEDDIRNGEYVGEEIDNILQLASVEALKQSLAKQDSSALRDVESTKTAIPLDRMGSSEEEAERSHFAPISSIDSASSDDERKPHLSAVAEESDDGVISVKEEKSKLEPVREVIKETLEHIPWNDIELKPALKKEASPSPSDKKVTFSHVEDEAEPHREDIDLPEGLTGIGPKRWSNLR